MAVKAIRLSSGVNNREIWTQYLARLQVFRPALGHSQSYSEGRRSSGFRCKTELSGHQWRGGTIWGRKEKQQIRKETNKQTKTKHYKVAKALKWISIQQTLRSLYSFHCFEPLLNSTYMDLSKFPTWPALSPGVWLWKHGLLILQMMPWIHGKVPADGKALFGKWPRRRAEEGSTTNPSDSFCIKKNAKITLSIGMAQSYLIRFWC